MGTGATMNPTNLQPSSSNSSRINLLLGIPLTLIQSSTNAPGHVNHSYHVKRVLYLLKVKQILLEGSLNVQDAKLVPFHDDMRRPVLELSVVLKKRAIRYSFLYFIKQFCTISLLIFAGTSSLHCIECLMIFFHRFCIVPTIPSTCFPVKSLAMDKCNLQVDASPNPTPFYNTSVLEDQLMAANDESFQTVYQNHKTEALSQALCLLRVWLDARCLLQTADALSEHAWFGIISHLLTEGSIVSLNHVVYLCFSQVDIKNLLKCIIWIFCKFILCLKEHTVNLKFVPSRILILALFLS